MIYYLYWMCFSKFLMCFWFECYLVVVKFYDVCCLFKEKIIWYLMFWDINSFMCWLVMVNFLDILEWKRCIIIKCFVLNWCFFFIVDCFLYVDLYKKEIYVDRYDCVYFLFYGSYLSFSICKILFFIIFFFIMLDYFFCCYFSFIFICYWNLIGVFR